MVRLWSFFKQNFQDSIFTPSREDMNTQKNGLGTI